MGPCIIHIVAGPAGAGKSTLCRVLQEHAMTLGGSRKRRILVANLDPAADEANTTDVSYTIDVRDCINVDEVMSELGLGPNGALIYCMEYLLENFDWLQEQLQTYLLEEDDYILFDCPGQLELYTHVPVMPRLIQILQQQGYTVASTFCVDAASTLGGIAAGNSSNNSNNINSFSTDANKFVSASLLSLSAMVALELPHVNVLTKCDLVPAEFIDEFLEQNSALDFIQECQGTGSRLLFDTINSSATAATGTRSRIRDKQWSLTQAIAQVLDDYSMVSFVPLNIRDEDSVDHVLSIMDHVVQFGEDAEVYGATHDADELGGDDDEDE